MKVINVVPVGYILVQLTSVAVEYGVTRSVWQPAKKNMLKIHDIVHFVFCTTCTYTCSYMYTVSVYIMYILCSCQSIIS